MAPNAKRRKLDNHKVEEVVFDPAARQDYLTGFHKRKVQRTKLAQEKAAQRARQEKIEDRKKLKEERQAELERHVNEVNQWLRPDGDAQGSGEESDNEKEGEDDDEEWEGVADRDPSPIDHEDEYIDEDKYTTVTVEEMDVTREGLSKVDQESDKEAQGDPEAHQHVNGHGETKKAPKSKTKDARPKKKRKKFRYENKGDRKMNRLKERAKNSKQARARRNG